MASLNIKLFIACISTHWCHQSAEEEERCANEL